jgi:hypothetical protein
MTKEQFISYVKQVQPLHINNDCVSLVYYYLNKEYNLKDINTVHKMAHVNPHRFIQGRANIIDRLKKEFNVIEVFDKDNKLINII